jgi:hypothetical protein
MIVNEPLLDDVFDESALARMSTYIAVVAGVLLLGWFTNRKSA